MDTKESFEHLCKLSTSQESFKFNDPTRPIDSYDNLEKLLKKYIRTCGNALDVGTFDGRFCFILASIGFKAYGIEPQKNAVRFAQDHRLNVFTGLFPKQLPEELLRIKFDLISFMESIYYFEDLKESLLTARDMLNDKGLILIKAHQVSSRYYHSKSLFSRYGEHVQWFPMYGPLKHCLKEAGFKIIKTIGTNPVELLPSGISWMKNVFLAGVANRIYNRLVLDYTLLDIKRADRLLILAEKL